MSDDKEKQIAQNAVNKKNGEMLHAVVKDLMDKHYEMSKLVQSLEQKINTLTTTVEEQERRLILWKVQTTGSGPSVKG